MLACTGTTVARLQQLVGAARHETLVFGDGLNDSG